MTSICIGIPVYEEPGQLRLTLESLWANTPKPFEVLLLPDGPDASMLSELSHLTHLPQSLTQEPQGTAACFNRLAAASQADVVILLESGCMVGKGWLQTLLAVMESNPSHGLAGPSTNYCWNQQSLAQHGVVHPSTFSTTGSLADVNRVSHTIMQRFGTSFHRLEPLHSLADFCYAVRRPVIDAVGLADEGYGLGPCWEMDYNIRAARAGFRGVWACGAYVRRGAFSRRRAVEEPRLFESSKRRYQDKFCALHLRQETTAYEPHCKGDECEHFAPVDLIQIHLPSTPAQQSPAPRTVPLRVHHDAPLVSCIMATRDRPDYVLQSIRYFQRQDYPNCELLILDDDSGPDLSSEIGRDSRLRYFRMPGAPSIGIKRNRGCELARGTFIAQWDDDDWYAASRLSAQLEPLLSGAAQVSALSAGVFFDLSRWQFWRVSAELHRRMFVGDVHGGTLVYHRSLFDRGVRYPDRSIAEDAWFLWYAMQRGAQVKKVCGDDLFVYVRHGRSSWEFRCGDFLDPLGWCQVELPTVLAVDIEFYRHMRPQEPERSASVPLVSCIMPTANRRKFVPRAIQCFQAQDYRNCELLVIDDGSDSVADLIPDDERISYVRLDMHPSLGAKRNLACEMARGEYILHWDDDDWASPSRISIQMQTMIARPEIDICGLDQLYFYDPLRAEAWLYSHPPGSRVWLAGNTLCYRKSLWQKRPFPEINEGEDTLFVWALSERQMLPLRNPNFFVAMIHTNNTSPKRTAGPGWNRVSKEEIVRVLGKAA